MKKTNYYKKLAWDYMSEKEKKECFEFAEKYKSFLSKVKTERESVLWLKNKIKNNYQITEFNSKAIAVSRIGKKPIEKGINLIVSHIDSPRLDLKQNPLYETVNMALLKTHYYGGIKKYQWLSIPLSLHFFIILDNGEKLQFAIGENPDEPVFTIADLLPHLSNKVQYQKKLSEAFQGEKLNIISGSLPLKNKKEKKERFKNAILEILYKKYKISEEDFISAECEIVPAGSARDIGFDRSMIGGYGQDDRICAYTSYIALKNAEKLNRTAMIIWLDKEEIGSVGNTGADSYFITDSILNLLKTKHKNVSYSLLRDTMKNSFCISADVACGINPDYQEVVEKNNAAELGFGVSIVKYTGSKGKSGANDAHAENISHLRNIFNKNNIIWQTGELGKIDEGGGGTVAKFISRLGIQTVDCGTPLLAMHSPFEIVHKADIFQTIKAYQSFFEN